MSLVAGLSQHRKLAYKYIKQNIESQSIVPDCSMHNNPYLVGSLCSYSNFLCFYCTFSVLFTLSWIEFYICEDQADMSVSDTQEQEDEESTDIRSPKKASRTVANTHAWVTIIDSSPTGNSRHSSTVSSDTVSQMSSSICSAKSDHDSISMTSEDALLEFDPQTSPTKRTNCHASILQHTMDDSGSCRVNSESRSSSTDREKHSNDYFEHHNYEPIDDQPILHQNKPTLTHASGQRPPVKLKANMGKEQVTIVPTSDTNIKQPTCTTPQQHTLLNMATPARHDYENHTLNFQQGDGQVSIPPRSLATKHVHGQPVSPTFCSPPRQEVFIERTNFKRLDTPRTLLAKKLAKLHELSTTPNPAPETITEAREEHTLPSTVTQRCNYENHTLPFERQSEEVSSAFLPPRTLTRTAAHSHVGSPPPMASNKSTPPRQEASIMERMLSNTAATQRCDYENHSLTSEHQNEEVSCVSFPSRPQTATHVRTPPPVASTPPGQETGVTERKDFSRLETPRTLLAMQSGNIEAAQEHSDEKVPTPENPNSEQPKAEEPHIRHNYENHDLKFKHPNTAATGVPLPQRSLNAANERSLPSAINNTPRQGETAVVKRTNFSRLATPSTLKRLASLQSGRPSSPSPDYVDEDYINTSLLSMSGLPSPTVKSGSTIAASPDYVDEDYINTALISQPDRCPPSASILGLATVDQTDEADYVNTTPPTTMKRGTRPPLSDDNDKEDDLVYDYPDLRNSRLLLSPKSHKVHRIKSVPLGRSRETPVPPRRTKRRSASDAANTQHLTAITQASLGTSGKLIDINGRENSFSKSSMNVGSRNSMSRQEMSASTQDYVSGYVNTELEHPLPCRKVERSTSVNEGANPVDSDEEFEYDYPNIERTIRFNFGTPHQKIRKKLAALPPRKGNSNGGSTTFSSALTSSNSGSSTSNVETPLPKWWLQLIEERERMRDNPDLYLHFATGRRRNYQQPVVSLPPRQTLQQQQHQQSASVCANRDSLGIDTDEYIVMASAGCTVDDNYVNWETIYNAREYTLSPHARHAASKTLPPRKWMAKDAESTPRRRYSIDDMQVTYNVNVPPREPVALPPRGVHRTIPEESKPESDVVVVKKRSSVVEAPQMKPQVKPKPAVLVAKQRDGNVSQSDYSKPSELNKPKPKPKPKLRPKPKIDPSTKPPLTRTVMSKEETKESRLTAKPADQPQHQDSSLSLNRLPHPPVPKPRPSRLSDHSAPSELALNVAK